MRTPRPEKKSETLEIRLGHSAKADFMARCQAEGRTASEALRVYIESGTRRRRRVSIGAVHAVAAAMAGLAIGAAAAPSVAQGVSPKPAFDQLDRDRDGVLTRAEFDPR